MILRTALCLAWTLALGAGAPRRAPVKPAAPVLHANPDVPAAGSAGERVEPATGRGRAVGPFLEPRSDYQATLFPDGRVLVTGGARSATSEWFDPATNRFAPGPAMTAARQGHRALLLKDGRLLVLGGTETPGPAEVLEPGAKAFKAVPDTRFGLSAEALELDEGRVFMVDGASGGLFTWDGRRSPSSKGLLNRPRNFFRLVRLKDGRVAVLGGWPSERKGRGRQTATGPNLPVECFNPRWSTLSTWTALPVVRARHQAALLEDGRICLWGGVGQDPDVAVAGMELLDPVKETVSAAPALDLQNNPVPGWATAGPGRGLFLPERSQRLLSAPDPLGLPAAAPYGRLANGYLGPVLVPLQDGSVLVLGTPAYGDPLDRWDARTRQCAVVGTLREGVEELALLPDGKVLALGPVVDLVDPHTGALTPLGWREDLEGLLKTVKAAASPAPAPWPKGQDRPDALVVPLDKGHALVVASATGMVELWDL